MLEIHFKIKKGARVKVFFKTEHSISYVNQYKTQDSKIPFVHLRTGYHDQLVFQYVQSRKTEFLYFVSLSFI
jgi:hypothetical protein